MLLLCSNTATSRKLILEGETSWVNLMVNHKIFSLNHFLNHYPTYHRPFLFRCDQLDQYLLVQPYFLYVIYIYIYMPENLYPKVPSAPLMSQQSFNSETIRKYHQDITDLKNKYYEKQRKYKNACNKLLHTSTVASSVGVISGISTIGTTFTVVGIPISASLGVLALFQLVLVEFC